MNDRVRVRPSDRIAVNRVQNAQRAQARTEQFVIQNEDAIGADVAREVLRDREAATRVITQQANEQLRATNSHIQTIPSAPADPADNTSLIDRAVAQEQQRRETLAALGAPVIVPAPPAPPAAPVLPAPLPTIPVPPPAPPSPVPPAPPTVVPTLPSAETPALPAPPAVVPAPPIPAAGSPTIASGTAPTGTNANPTSSRTQAASTTAASNSSAGATGASSPNTAQLGSLRLEFEPNAHNQYDRVNYWFKLSMINDLDAEDPNLLTKFLRREIRQITVAESGVTTGFNLGDVEIQDVISANFRNRSSLTTEIKMQLFEPYSLTLPDRLFKASKELGIKNWRLAPMMLQLEFRYIRQTGEIFNPTNTEKLVKVYQILILDFDAQLKETGTQYDITAAVKGNLGFRDAYHIMPQSHRINTETTGSAPPNPPATPATPAATQAATIAATTTPAATAGIKFTPAANTVGAFFEKLGETITDLYVKNRAGAVGQNVSTVQLPVMIYKFWVEPRLAEQELNFSPENSSRRASFPTGNTSSGEITVSRGISVSTLVDDILASLKDPNFFLTSPQQGGLVKIPVIECVTKNVGWDLLRNDYVREFNFVIRMKDSNRPVPFQAFGEAVQANTQNQQARLRAISKTLRKRYDYFYTGLNTEILNCDIKFNQLHIIPTPLLDVTPPVGLTDSAVVPANSDVINPEQIAREAAQAQARINTAIQGLQAIERSGSNPDALLPQVQANQAAIASAEERIRLIGKQSVVPFDNEPAAERALSDITNRASTARDLITAITSVRDRNRAQAANRQFAEDIDIKLEDNMLRLSYYADPRDVVNMLTRPAMIGTPAGNSDASTATRPLVSTILSQIYDRGGQHLLELDLEIRGDPYWLGLTDTERNQELLAWMNTIQPGGVAPPENTTAANREAFVNRYDQDANILVKFRAGSPPDQSTGFQNLTDGSTFFYGVYTVIECTHEFKQGKFTQRLKAIRDMLINVNDLRAAETGASATQPRQVAPAQPGPAQSSTPGSVSTRQATARVNTTAEGNSNRPVTESPQELTPLQQQLRTDVAAFEASAARFRNS